MNIFSVKTTFKLAWSVGTDAVFLKTKCFYCRETFFLQNNMAFLLFGSKCFYRGKKVDVDVRTNEKETCNHNLPLILIKLSIGYIIICLLYLSTRCFRWIGPFLNSFVAFCARHLQSFLWWKNQGKKCLARKPRHSISITLYVFLPEESDTDFQLCQTDVSRLEKPIWWLHIVSISGWT